MKTSIYKCMYKIYEYKYVTKIYLQRDMLQNVKYELND